MTNHTTDSREKVRAKIIEAVPEIKVPDEATRFSGSPQYRPRPITLADVLRAIPHLKPKDSRNFVVGQAESSGNRNYMEVLSRWNLALPFDEQSPEVIEFLAKVLGVKEQPHA